MPEHRITTAADATERFERALDGHRLLGHSNQRGKGAAGEFLAVPAMADCCVRRVGLCCVAHRAAEATTFNLDLDPLALSLVSYIVAALWPRLTVLGPSGVEDGHSHDLMRNYPSVIECGLLRLKLSKKVFELR